MKRQRKKTGQDQFTRTMFTAAIIGLSIIVLTVAYMFKLFAGDKVGAHLVGGHQESFSHELEEGEPASHSLVGVIYNINSRNIKIWDIEAEKHLKVNIKRSTEIKDKHGRLMTRHDIQKGSIVEITYKIKDKEILSIQESTRAWEEVGVTNLNIDMENNIIKMNNHKYQYRDDVMVTNMESTQIDLSYINSSDTLKVRGIDNQILSIQVLETGGYLKLANVPSSQGVVEIGNNKIYQIGEIQDGIPLPVGDHKIVIHINGYEPYLEHIELTEEEIYTINLGQMKEIISSLNIRVVNTNEDYTVKINNKSYKKGETIKVKPGDYTLGVVAEGFKPLELQINIKEGHQSLSINLEEEEQIEDGSQPSNQTNTRPNTRPGNSNNTNKNTGSNSSSNTGSNTGNKEKAEEEIKTVQIIIETEPAEAQVFVSGVYKGTTPTLTGLKPGEYSITIEKEGYNTLYSTIIIDASNSQKGFLYTLEEEE
ncbi:MAG: PEGA domain-containing protein [Epulopiscium sp.]|nr:PEGA domain-containing protein [Candidatus Epulonipiscium sp.]